MDNEIFNKQGLFYHDDNEFTGIIKKNENGSIEFNTLNPIVISNDDFVLIRGHVNGKKVSFVSIIILFISIQLNILEK